MRKITTIGPNSATRRCVHNIAWVVMVVAGVLPLAGLCASNGATGKTPGNPILGHWQFDHLQPQAKHVKHANLRRVRAAVAPMRTITVHFGTNKLTLTKPGGKQTSYPVHYHVDVGDSTVTMIEQRKQQTVKQTYHLMPSKPNRIYTVRNFGPVGPVHMVYKRINPKN